VADGGQWMGCVSSNVHTDQLLVWDTLEVFFAIFDFMMMDEVKTRWTNSFKQ
jgi:hypothetical protein